MTSFKDLEVWQKTMALLPRIYDIANKLPSYERFALSDQLRRAIISIASNIAEGSKRGTKPDFRHFCAMAQGSAAEVETQLLAVKQLYPNIVVRQELSTIVDIQKMLTKLIQRLL